MKSIVFILLAFLACFSIDDFTYSTDSLVIRTILDSNGLSFAKVEYCTQTDSSNRISQLILRKRGIHYLPFSIGNLTHLQYLWLDENSIDSIPSSIGRMSNLVAINLNQNPLRKLPDSICNLPNLTALYLENCPLDSLPDSIGDLTALQSLELYSSNLTRLPASICNLRNLIDLGISHGRLSLIPDSIGKLAQLTILYLYENALTTLPSSITNLTKLIDFRLCNNTLCSLQADIGYWADWFSPGWRTCQSCPLSSLNNTKSFRKPYAISQTPSNRASYLRLSLEKESAVDLSLINIQGKLIYSRYFKFMRGSYSIPLAMDPYSAGIYLMRLRINGSLFNEKLLLVE